MRLPRWLMVSLIAVSVVALLAVPTWLWVEMPRRTAVRFAEMIDANNATAANRLVMNASCVLAWNGQWSLLITQRGNGQVSFILKAPVEFIRREPRDILLGRQRFRLGLIEFNAAWNSVSVVTHEDWVGSIGVVY